MALLYITKISPRRQQFSKYHPQNQELQLGKQPQHNADQVDPAHIQNPPPLALVLLTPHYRPLRRKEAVVMLHRNNECPDPQRAQRSDHSNALEPFSPKKPDEVCHLHYCWLPWSESSDVCVCALTHTSLGSPYPRLSLTGSDNPGLSSKAVSGTGKATRRTARKTRSCCHWKRWGYEACDTAFLSPGSMAYRVGWKTRGQNQALDVTIRVLTISQELI